MEDWYTRKYESDYGVELVERTKAVFEENAAVTEAFFSLHGQIDMLVEEHDVFLNDGERQISDDWTPELVLSAVDEVALLARKQNSPAWPAIMAIASAMRVMIRSVPVMPLTEFKQDEAAGIPPGLFALMQKEDVRPFDFAVASLSGDMSPDSMVGVAVLAERVRCESTVKGRIEDLLSGRPPENLGSEEGWAHEQLERVRREIACPQVDEQPAGESAAELAGEQ